MTGQLGTIVAAWERIRKGKDVIAPDQNLSVADNFLYMLRGEKPDADESRMMDVCLILHADHELNASTFTTRVVAGTLADMYGCVTAGIAALAGPLHGGANTAVMKMLTEIDNLDAVDGWLEKALEEKRKIMGIGHAVYKTEDPRATWVRRYSKAMAKKKGIRKLITAIWIDADEYEAALAFWKKEHDRYPASRDVLQTVAGIYLKSGDWRSAIEWYRKDVEASKDIAGKIAALSAIANVSFGKLFGGREKVFGAERCEIAEIGLQAAEEGIKLDPKAIALWGTSQGLWANRSVANGQSWAYQIDQAEAQVFAQQARVLREEAKKAQAAAGGDAPAAPAGTPPGSGT